MDAAKELKQLIKKPRKQIHQSTVEQVSKCGVAAEYKYVMKLKSRPKTFLICGTAVDRATDLDLGVKKDTGVLETEDVVCDAARDSVENYPDKEEFVPEDDEKDRPVREVLDETKDKAVRLVRAHHGKIAPEIQPTDLHRRFSIDLDKWLRNRAKEIHAQADELPNGQLKRALDQQARYLNVAARDGMDFVGEWDIRESIFGSEDCTCGAIRMDDDGTCAACGKIVRNPTLTIRDTKTAKKTPAQDIADTSHQLSAYAAAAYVVDGKVPDKMKLDYLIDLKKETKAMTLTTTRDINDVQKYLNRLVPVITSFQSGIFLPAPDIAWYCSEKYCSYWGICPHVRHVERTVGNVSELIQIGGSNAQSNTD